MFNVDMLTTSLDGCGFEDLKAGDGEVKDVGTLDMYDRAIKFVANHHAIYANGKPILSTFNDRWTATEIFTLTMKAAYGDRFIPSGKF